MDKDRIGKDEFEKFLYELGFLKNMQRSGWLTLGIRFGDSVASHSFRAAIISYYLAKKLNANVEKTLLMTLFHDVPETRIGDINKISKKYLKADKLKVIENQFSELFPEIKELAKEFIEQKTLEAKIARDSDILEVIVQAKEFENINKLAKEFYENAYNRLELEESKKIATKLINSDVVWWKGMKDLER